MTLLEHAQYELDLIDCSEPEKSAILAAVEGFSKGGWSGGGVGWGIETLTRLLQYKPLSEVTSDRREWMKIQDELAQNELNGLWQNKRRSSTFSRDGGKTWYDIEDPTLNNGDAHRPNEAWTTVELGENVKAGDEVRVKFNAYGEGSLALRHNGQIGTLLLVNGGRCAVRYLDGYEYMHDPSKLEVPKTS